MKALARCPIGACDIALGNKPIEYRSWDTRYRGDLLICSMSGGDGADKRHAVCVAELYKTEPSKWHLRHIRPIVPFYVRCRQYIFDVNVSKIDYLKDEDGKQIVIEPSEQLSMSNGEAVQIIMRTWADMGLSEPSTVEIKKCEPLTGMAARALYALS